MFTWLGLGKLGGYTARRFRSWEVSKLTDADGSNAQLYIDIAGSASTRSTSLPIG